MNEIKPYDINYLMSLPFGKANKWCRENKYWDVSRAEGIKRYEVIITGKISRVYGIMTHTPSAVGMTNKQIKYEVEELIEDDIDLVDWDMEVNDEDRITIGSINKVTYNGKSTNKVMVECYAELDAVRTINGKAIVYASDIEDIEDINYDNDGTIISWNDAYADLDVCMEELIEDITIISIEDEDGNSHRMK